MAVMPTLGKWVQYNMYNNNNNMHMYMYMYM